MAFDVGDRVAVNDHFGTIRYKGPIEKAKGEYYGVEWDVASRGKHNGTHDGKTYFVTSGNENSASFVKEKLISSPVRCIDAIKDKYGKVEDGADGIDESQAYLSQATGHRVINIEVVGMKKIGDLQSQFDMLTIVNVAWMCVNGETDPEELGRFVPKTQELNLSYNVLNSWRSVANIIRCLESLQCLHLNGNRLSYDEGETDGLAPAFSRIKQLSMINMNLTWKEVLQCSQLWLQVEELQLLENRIREIDVSPDWQQLKLLNLAGNCLRSWSNVRPFGRLPKLEEMYISNCQLSDIQVEDGEFPALRLLDLRENHIAEWKHIGQLNKMAALTELIFLANPVLELTDVETNRQIVIARIFKLTRHNRSKVEGQERKGAEIDYLKRYGEEWIQAGGSAELSEGNAQFYIEHPTYQHLIKKWGAPEKTEVIKSKPKSAIKESLIEVTFVDLVTESGKKVTKYIPYTMSVVKCRNLAIKLLGIKRIPSVITYRSHKNGEEYDFEYDLRQLTFYGVQHGDEILLRQIP